MKRSYVVIAFAALVTFGAAAARAQLKGNEQAPSEHAAQTTEQTEKFLYLVDHFARLSENPTSAGIGAVLEAADVLKDRPQDAIAYFNNALPDVKNESVRRVIRLQLAELYRRTNQPDKALDQLREVMVLAPAGGLPHAAKTTGAFGSHSPAAPSKRSGNE
jgi:predicted negative regulator of RcsB-dependent stress response